MEPLTLLGRTVTDGEGNRKPDLSRMNIFQFAHEIFSDFTNDLFRK